MKKREISLLVCFVFGSALLASHLTVMAHLEALLGKEVLGKDGSTVAVSSLVDNDLLGT